MKLTMAMAMVIYICIKGGIVHKASNSTIFVATSMSLAHARKCLLKYTLNSK